MVLSTQYDGNFITSHRGPFCKNLLTFSYIKCKGFTMTARRRAASTVTK